MRSAAVALLSLVAAVAGAAPCPSGSATGAFLAPGAYGTAHRTETFVDASRETPAHRGIAALPQRTLVVEIWYPTAEPASMVDSPDVASGRFPLVVNSPGYGDQRRGESYVTAALASRGYVVASIDFPLTNAFTADGKWLPDAHNQPGDVRFVIDQLLAASRTRGGWLHGRIDRRRIGLEGLSLGGFTTLLTAYHPRLRDRRVKGAVTFAALACPLPTQYLRSGPPLLILQGTLDRFTPAAENGERVFARARVPRELVRLAGGTHVAFSGYLVVPLDESYDTVLGCALPQDFTPELFDSTYAAFGRDGARLDDGACTLPCSDPAPVGTVMAAARQHDLTVAATVAFFESRFRRSRAARCFLRHGLAAENPDVTTAVAR